MGANNPLTLNVSSWREDLDLHQRSRCHLRSYTAEDATPRCKRAFLARLLLRWIMFQTSAVLDKTSCDVALTTRGAARRRIYGNGS